MDEFGVLTERYGLKPQGKSAPMASSKRPTNFGVDSGLNPKSPPYSFTRSNSNSDYGVFHSGSDGFPDDIFGGPIKPAKQSGISGYDFDSMFSGPKSASFSSYNDAYDVFDVMLGMKGSVSDKNIAKDDDFFGSFDSVPKPSAPADDLLGDLSEAREKLQTLNVQNGKVVDKPGKVWKNGDDVGDLIPGFGEANNGTHEEKSSDQQSTVHSTKTNFTSSLEQDPFVVVDTVSTSTSTPAYDFTVLEEISKLSNSRGVNIDGSPDIATKLKSPQNPAQVSKRDPVVDALTNNRQGPKPQNTARSPVTMEKSSSQTSNTYDPFSQTDGEFQEVEGESEERRRARLERHQKTKERQLEAVAEMNRRDRRIQQEQEEKCRIADTLDNKIKRWSYGKEGNMRALLSSLQCVLWPDSGWVPVSLTDVYAARDVKKVYTKAKLCVHPDKVQQKGVEEKYIAEKVFDILKAGWNKFHEEEMS